MPTEMTAISYSWDDDLHKKWIKEFATRLRADGVDATLDQWHLGLGDRLPPFMESLIRDSRFVSFPHEISLFSKRIQSFSALRMVAPAGTAIHGRPQRRAQSYCK